MTRKIIFSKTVGIYASVLLGCFFFASSCKRSESDAEKENQTKYLEQVSYLNVKITDNFWGPKIKLSGENGIPSVFEAGKTSFENFDIASGKTEGEHNQRMASDSDVFKKQYPKRTIYSLLFLGKQGRGENEGVDAFSEW